MSSFSFREINFHKPPRNSESQGHFLDICLYNYYDNKVADLIDSVFENLSANNFNYRLTVLDLRELAPTDVSLFVADYPQVRLFLPAKNLSIEAAINLYVKESKANYILMLSGEFERLEINLDIISLAFRENEPLLGVVPKILRAKKPAPSVYGLSVFKKKLFLSYDSFAANQLTIKAHKMNLFLDRDRYLALGGLATDWGSFFLSNLDLGYRAYAGGHKLKTCEQFILHSSEEKSDDYLDDFKPIYGSLEFALRCFKIKHFKERPSPLPLLFLLIFNGLRLNFRWINRVGHWLRYRKNVEENVKNEKEIMSLLK